QLRQPARTAPRSPQASAAEDVQLGNMLSQRFGKAGLQQPLLAVGVQLIDELADSLYAPPQRGRAASTAGQNGERFLEVRREAGHLVCEGQPRLQRLAKLLPHRG